MAQLAAAMANAAKEAAVSAHILFFFDSFLRPLYAYTAMRFARMRKR